MPISEARKRANKKYIDKQEEIKLRVAEGRKKQIKAHAENLGMSLNSYINKLIDDDMQTPD